MRTAGSSLPAGESLRSDLAKSCQALCPSAAQCHTTFPHKVQPDCTAHQVLLWFTSPGPLHMLLPLPRVSHGTPHTLAPPFCWHGLSPFTLLHDTLFIPLLKPFTLYGNCLFSCLGLFLTCQFTEGRVSVLTLSSQCHVASTVDEEKMSQPLESQLLHVGTGGAAAPAGCPRIGTHVQYAQHLPPCLARCGHFTPSSSVSAHGGNRGIDPKHAWKTCCLHCSRSHQLKSCHRLSPVGATLISVRPRENPCPFLSWPSHFGSLPTEQRRPLSPCTSQNRLYL